MEVPQPVLQRNELDDEAAQLLPNRETLCQFACTNLVNVVGVNVSLAVNAATIGSSANALATQYLHTAVYHR